MEAQQKPTKQRCLGFVTVLYYIHYIIYYILYYMKLYYIIYLGKRAPKASGV